jgi:hypothetical protein
MVAEKARGCFSVAPNVPQGSRLGIYGRSFPQNWRLECFGGVGSAWACIMVLSTSLDFLERIANTFYKTYGSSLVAWRLRKGLAKEGAAKRILECLSKIRENGHVSLAALHHT